MRGHNKETFNITAPLLEAGFFFIVNNRERETIWKSPEPREKADWTCRGLGTWGWGAGENNGNSKRQSIVKEC